MIFYFRKLSASVWPRAAVSMKVLLPKYWRQPSPVKNALTRLLHNSYVVRQPRYRVAAFSEKEYTDIAELSELIEPYAAGRAAIAIKGEELDALYDIAEQLSTASV